MLVKRESQTAAETIRALGTQRMRRLTRPREVEHRVRMLLGVAYRQIERGDSESARVMLSALRPEDFGRSSRRAEGPLATLHRTISTSDLRLLVRTFELLLPPV